MLDDFLSFLTLQSLPRDVSSAGGRAPRILWFQMLMSQMRFTGFLSFSISDLYLGLQLCMFFKPSQMLYFTDPKHDTYLNVHLSLLKAIIVEELPGNTDSEMPNDRVTTVLRQFKDKWHQAKLAINTRQSTNNKPN